MCGPERRRGWCTAERSLISTVCAHKAYIQRINIYYFMYNLFPFSTKCNVWEECWYYGNCFNKVINIHEGRINISYWQWFTSDVDKLLWTLLVLTCSQHTDTRLQQHTNTVTCIWIHTSRLRTHEVHTHAEICRSMHALLGEKTPTKVYISGSGNDCV